VFRLTSVATINDFRAQHQLWLTNQEGTSNILRIAWKAD
jgi:hypothetical protein